MKLAAAFVALALVGCAAPSRFALRPPVLRDGDDRPFAPAPKASAESDYANSADVILLRPISHFFLFEPSHEARNATSLDEVADSSWYTNRRPTPEEVARGACTDEPAPPFVVKSSKGTGTTPGFVVKDAAGHTYLMKLDDLAPRQPEISTAADAIVSRFYWALGFNAPCNRVLYVREADLRVDRRSVEKLRFGGERPLTEAGMLAALRGATRGPDGAYRVSTSRFIDGQPVGTWRTEGRRADDPNDVIPHEDRRELRAERLLAAWVAHWDSRGPNSFDAFVATHGQAGYVRHYFLDFSDALGGVPIRTPWPEPRMGYATVSDVPQIAGDLVGLGLVRRPWDDVKTDPRYPNLGYLDVAHFDPLGFAPQTPMVRWARADASDLGWIARKIARLGAAHVRAAVDEGRLPRTVERDRLVDVLMGRRDAILRAAFARSSPLGEVELDGERLCASDLAIVAGVSRPRVTYTVSVPSPLGAVAAIEPVRGARVCVRMPRHFADRALPDDAAARYAVVEIARHDGAARTRIRVHVYDLDARGWFVAGIERL